MKTKISCKYSAPFLIFLALIIFGATNIKAAAGDLDPTFSGDGKLTDVVGRGNEVAIQSDGKIVVAGQINANFAVARYNPDGSPDTGFGADGKVITQISHFISYARSVTIQPDGKIVAAGFSIDSFLIFTVVRYNTNGSLDDTFGGDGIVQTRMLSDDFAEDVAIQPDGKIIVAGCTNTFYDYDCDNWALARYNPDGSLDTTFDSDGRVITPFGMFIEAYLYSIAIEPDGKIVGAGYSRNGSTNDFTVIRYNVDGSLDPTFDSDGKVTTPIGPGDDKAYSVAIQPDGKLVAAGHSSNGSDDDFAVVRYNANGSLDTAFDSDGKVTTAMGSGGDIASAVVIQYDGKIVASGQSYSDGNSLYDFALARYNPNGSLDTAFGGGDGKTIVDFNNSTDYAYGMVLDNAGRAVVVGESLERIALARFLLGPDLRRNGKIAFTGDREGNMEIYVMNSDGSGQTRLTNNTAIDYLPAFSPDGRKIAFVSQRTISTLAADIKIMNADGTNQTVIIPVTLSNHSYEWDEFRSLSWSPDGRMIAFDDAGEIFTVNVDGSDRTNLTNHPANDYAPAWSPDGTRILFSSSRVGYLTMHTMNAADGSDVRVLPSSGYSWDESPDWSPTGDKIVFVLNSEDFQPIIYTADADGTNRQIFDGNGSGSRGIRNKPKWSPDSTKIVFHNYKFPSMDCEIYVKDVDGGRATQLTDTTGNNFQPSWQPLLPARTFADFDGDGKSDISVFRRSDRVWYLNQSTAGFSATQFGLSTDKITPADYDGDGKTDIAVYRDGVWHLLRSTAGFAQIQFGLAGDIPQPADFDGDGRAELAVYRGGTWYSYNLANNHANAVQFGVSTDKPVAADYDGDGRADQAVYRNGEWHLNRSSQGYAVVKFGLSNDKPVIGDYDGDGKTDEAVYRNGNWYVLQSSQGYTQFQFGLASDIPAPADYDGDGRTDAAVYRDGVWYLRQSTDGISIQQFGLNGDIPIAGIQ